MRSPDISKKAGGSSSLSIGPFDATRWTTCVLGVRVQISFSGIATVRGRAWYICLDAPVLTLDVNAGVGDAQASAGTAPGVQHCFEKRNGSRTCLVQMGGRAGTNLGRDRFRRRGRRTGGGRDCARSSTN